MAGRPPLLNSGHRKILGAIVRAHPSASHAEILEMLFEKGGLRISEATLRRVLRSLGFRRHLPEDTPAGDSPSPPLSPYGYADPHRSTGNEARYATSLTDAEWALVEDLFRQEGAGKPPRVPRRHLVDACVYVVRTGCSWRLLPKDFPSWQNVYAHFRRWAEKGVFETMHDRFRAMWRAHEGRAVSPSACCVDSQSVKTSEQGGPKGYDAGKKVKGRKRHLVVDTLGLLLAVLILPANTQDRDGAFPTVQRAVEKYPGIETVFADAGYAGAQARRIQSELGPRVEIVRHPANRTTGSLLQVDMEFPEIPKRGFTLLPKRWVVERTHAWNGKCRRMAKDYDRCLDVAEAWIWLLEARLLLKRVANI